MDEPWGLPEATGPSTAFLPRLVFENVIAFSYLFEAREGANERVVYKIREVI